MCSYRRVDVRYPDGREIRLIVNEDRDNGYDCESCGLDVAAFTRCHLPPHDTIQHQVLYFGATVKRGRRLSPGEIKRLHPALKKRDGAPAPAPVPLPGFLVDTRRFGG